MTDEKNPDLYPNLTTKTPPQYDDIVNDSQPKFQQPHQRPEQEQGLFEQPQQYPYQDNPSSVITQQPVMVMQMQSVGPDPSTVNCQSCNTSVLTKIEYEISTKTHLIAGILCLVGCWCFVWVPYCVKSCHNRNHYCPTCGTFIGSYKG